MGCGGVRCAAGAKNSATDCTHDGGRPLLECDGDAQLLGGIGEVPRGLRGEYTSRTRMPYTGALLEGDRVIRSGRFQFVFCNLW